ncbi:mannose-6-phosphate isomerase, class I [Virgibacillus salinus]|uniref:Mannose-6-phosphate isomerase n=1 Tax=Virgibacillus salinus TaxID=553311 RepID=A0A1H0YVX8_9BACI|nr:mannose-6-phosphate isomerase, class I [Virgibacillus salinus]SDQ19325.1 mannose-6-phosphate isomerase, type 1 [Virgibacillus salinus]
MYNEPIFLKPVFQERIWGGNNLQTLFGYDIPNNKTGEAWVISAHSNGPSEIVNGPLQGKNLAEAWKEHPEIFGKTSTEGDFPLLVKILDANNDLSVQVHPDDTYAREVEGESYGKTECWYVLDCEEGAEIVLGHHAQSAEEFKGMVNSGDWDKLLRRVKVQKGDFIYVPSGTIHAIGKAIVILEIQQSSDITYRVYDYDRTDTEGNTRELHVDAAIEVTNYPHEEVDSRHIEKVIDDLVSTQLVDEKYFSVYHWKLDGEVSRKLESFLLVSVISGKGNVMVDGQTFPVQIGDHFILPSTVEEYIIEGDLEIIASVPGMD